MTMKWKRALAALMTAALALTLGGCTSGIPALNHETGVTLPPTQVSWKAPTGDTSQEMTQAVLLYVPDNTGTRLIAQSDRISYSAARHPAEATLRQLFAFKGAGSASALTQNATLQLSPVNPVEISGDTATVNLGTSALMLAHSELYVVCQAIANTLCQWGDIQYVNVLVSSTQPGLDVAASVPAGCFTQNLTDTIDMLSSYAQSLSQSGADRRFSTAATLYFPSLSGKGILAESRTLNFASRSKTVLIETLLDALSTGAQTIKNVPGVPSLAGYLNEAPVVEDVAVSGGQQAVLRFRASFNDALISAGIPRSVMMASLTYTITTFVPGISGVTVYIGDERVTGVVPSGIYEGAGEAITFDDGRMRRSHFSAFLLSQCTLYFADGEGKLCAVQRPIPYYQTRSVRYLLNCLMQGPQPYDSVGGLTGVMPSDARDADLLGVAVNSQRALINLSQHFMNACAGYDESAERLLIYAIVNTLTELPGIDKTALFVAGAQPDSLCGQLYLPGEFMRNTALIRQN